MSCIIEKEMKSGGQRWHDYGIYSSGGGNQMSNTRVARKIHINTWDRIRWSRTPDSSSGVPRQRRSGAAPLDLLANRDSEGSTRKRTVVSTRSGSKCVTISSHAHTRAWKEIPARGETGEGTGPNLLPWGSSVPPHQPQSPVRGTH